MRTMIVLPTYNEAENLAPLVQAILDQGDFDVLVVDDASPDGTGPLAQVLKACYPGRVEVLHRSGKLGLGSAYVAGFKRALAAGYDVIYEMDADFSHDPADLPRLLAALESADVAVGSRAVAGGRTRNWPLWRRAISRGGSLYARLILGLPILDVTSGFKCFRRQALEALDLDAVHSNGYAFQIELNYRCHRLGLRIAEVPILFVDRRVGRSKMGLRIIWEAMRLVWRLRWESLATRGGVRAKSVTNRARCTRRRTASEGYVQLIGRCLPEQEVGQVQRATSASGNGVASFVRRGASQAVVDRETRNDGGHGDDAA